MRCQRYLCASLLVCASTLTSAEGIPVEPGLWESTTVIKSSMLPQPMKETTRECVTETEVTPELFIDQEDQSCAVSDVNVTSDTITWKMVCQEEGGQAKGDGILKVNGDEMSGKMQMTMSMQGMEVTMDSSWTGQRIGPCP